MSATFPMLQVRANLRQAYREANPNATILDSIKAVKALDDDTVHGAAYDVAVSLGMKPVIGAIGDGSIIAAIVAFFQSPQGQALMAALIKLLLGLIGG